MHASFYLLGDLLEMRVTKQPVHSGRRPKFTKLQQKHERWEQSYNSLRTHLTQTAELFNNDFLS